MSFATATGDCCTTHAAPGCDVDACADCVCASAFEPEAACCTTTWGSTCAALAGAVGECSWRCPCGTCGDGAPNLGEECDDGNQADDDGCQSDCTLTAGVSSCCVATHGPNCDRADCQRCVCLQHEECCLSRWDGACAALARGVCAPTCGCGGP